MDFLIVGNGMFGAAVARHLAPHAKVTVVGPGARGDGSVAYGAHHDEGRIIGDLSGDAMWSELNRRAHDGLTELDPALITRCGALSATARGGSDGLSAAAKIRGRQGTKTRILTADAARARFPMVRLGPGETARFRPAPIRCPDGRSYLKIGANTMIDRWLPDPAAVRAWYDRGDGSGPLPALREALTRLLPGVRARAWHTRRCADAYTAHRHPYIDILEPGRLTIAPGGNGRGAQAADAVGHLAAGLALAGRWQSDLPHDAFRHVPGHGPWNGMTLLRDAGCR